MDIFKNSIYNSAAEVYNTEPNRCICFQPIDILKPNTGFCTSKDCRYSKPIVTCGSNAMKCEFDRFGDRKHKETVELPEDFDSWKEYWTFVYETNKKRGKDIL